jgi:hypothetical protein
LGGGGVSERALQLRLRGQGIITLLLPDQIFTSTIPKTAAEQTGWAGHWPPSMPPPEALGAAQGKEAVVAAAFHAPTGAGVVQPLPSQPSQRRAGQAAPRKAISSHIAGRYQVLCRVRVQP